MNGLRNSRITTRLFAMAAAFLLANGDSAIASGTNAAGATATSGVTVVGFDLLASYNFEVPEGPMTNTVDTANAQIPEKVRAFNKRKVTVTGFMLPLKVDNGTVTEFLLMRDQSMCCFGSTPKINEWVSVKAGSKGFKSVMDQAVTVEGTLHVGAIQENGYLIGLYSMDADKMTGPN